MEGTFCAAAEESFLFRKLLSCTGINGYSQNIRNGNHCRVFLKVGELKMVNVFKIFTFRDSGWLYGIL